MRDLWLTTIRNLVPSSSVFDTSEETYLTRHAKIARQSSNKMWIFCLPKRSKHSKHGGFKRGGGFHKNLNAIHFASRVSRDAEFYQLFFPWKCLLSLPRAERRIDRNRFRRLYLLPVCRFRYSNFNWTTRPVITGI